MRPVKERWAAWRRRRRAAAEDRERWRRFARRHSLVLEQAAGISSVTIVCHGDTWRFVERIAFPATHILLVSCIRVFAEPFPCDRVERGTAGMVTVTLSGPHLVRCLSVFWSVRVLGPRFAEPSWFAMISRLYALLAELVDGIDPQSCRGGLPPLIVDAGLKADEPVTA